jgi:hypothetical protein
VSVRELVPRLRKEFSVARVLVSYALKWEERYAVTHCIFASAMVADPDYVVGR